jgi:hypothetical protein
MPRRPISETICMTLGGFGLVSSMCASMLAESSGIASADPIDGSDADWDGILHENTAPDGDRNFRVCGLIMVSTQVGEFEFWTSKKNRGDR